MKLSDKSQRKRYGIQLLHAEVACADVVIDLAHAVTDISSVLDLVDELYSIAGGNGLGTNAKLPLIVRISSPERPSVKSSACIGKVKEADLYLTAC